jgi:hypothetical protein
VGITAWSSPCGVAGCNKIIVGGTTIGGNYANNLFLESEAASIIFNTNGRTSASVPNMIVHSSGNVGIGTFTPTGAFDVGGTSTSTFYTFLNGLRLSGADLSIYHDVSNNDLTFHTNWSSRTSGSILLCTRATARLTIDGPTGNVLLINGLIFAADNWQRSSDSTRQRVFFASNGTNYYQGYNGNGTYNHEFRKSANAVTMGIQEAGNGSCTGSFTNGSSSYMFAGGLRIGGHYGNTLYNDTKLLGITTLNKIIFNTGTSLANYATRMTIDTSGNVGIGNNAPWAPLNVGDCSVANSNGFINFGKRDNAGAFRNFKLQINN